MNWIKNYFSRDVLIISAISILLFTAANFLFVYYSPSFMKVVPSNIVRSISPCYRTLFHRDQESLESVNFVFGDSFSEGMGDEFLDGDHEYGFFNKLSDDHGSSELIFGRSGHGSLGTIIEFKQCFPLLADYTNLQTSKIDRYHVTFVFYEGNDLNDNLVEKDREISGELYNLRFFFPLYELTYKAVLSLANKIKQYLRSEVIGSDSPAINDLPGKVITSSGVEIPVYPQSAATELDLTELKNSLSISISVLEEIRTKLPAAEKYMLLYIPAVASSYSFHNELRVQSYSGDSFFSTTDDFNNQRHQMIVNLLRRAAFWDGWFICDLTPEILARTNTGIPVHGPRDWKHFNKTGYSIVAKGYEQCLRMSRGEKT